MTIPSWGPIGLLPALGPADPYLRLRDQLRLQAKETLVFDLDVLNSATKYPSIPTYHALGERGSLTEDATVFDGTVVLTEKVDGTNCRIVLMPDGDWFVGSREEILTARSDRVPNPAQGIVNALHDAPAALTGYGSGRVTVYYLEAYGAKIGSHARQYSGTGAAGYRMFDIAFIPLEVLDWDREKIAAWRDNGGQAFATEHVLERAAEVEGIALTPRLGTVPASQLPSSVAETHRWLAETIPATRARLDESAGGKPEGVVLRAADRSVIAKARFEDYDRTIRRRGPARTAAPAKAAV